ncbi:MAG TPA: amidohydrolase family protein [Thermoanaerobaculia bacterium]|nr:amidohydrolase family protein [Thermoanaerobaculia bacterium]
MPVFDVHIHVQPWSMVRRDALAMIDDASHRDAVSILSNADSVLRYLDESGVERACCINYVAPEVMGFTAEVNEWIAHFTKGHRDRLLPVGSVHPRHTKNARAETARILDLGIRMIKIHPPHQRIAPNAPELADVYRECESRGVPVMFHTGTSVFPRARNVFADPMPIDDVAIDFPNLKIILAHAGRPLYGETAFFLARRHPNVHLEISGIPPKLLPRYVPRLADIADKVLWGTDWPAPGVTSLRKNIDDFRALNYGANVERKVFWENAVRLFPA